MRVLGSVVLALEAIIVILAIPLAATNGSVDNTGLAIGIGIVMAVLLVLAIGTLGRPWGVGVGWGLQVLVLAIGFYVPMMFVVGAVFALLWFVAVRNGRRVDGLRAREAVDD